MSDEKGGLQLVFGLGKTPTSPGIIRVNSEMNSEYESSAAESENEGPNTVIQFQFSNSSLHSAAKSSSGKKSMIKEKQKLIEGSMSKLLKSFKDRDQYQFFLYPVDPAIAPGYLDAIKMPMDFSTMEEKINKHQYNSLDGFVSDFELVCNNCMAYNLQDSVYYKAGKKLLNIGLKHVLKEKKVLKKALVEFDEVQEGPTHVDLSGGIENNESEGNSGSTASVATGTQKKYTPLSKQVAATAQESNLSNRIKSQYDDPKMALRVRQTALKASEDARKRLARPVFGCNKIIKKMVDVDEADAKGEGKDKASSSSHKRKEYRFVYEEISKNQHCKLDFVNGQGDHVAGDELLSNILDKNNPPNQNKDKLVNNISENWNDCTKDAYYQSLREMKDFYKESNKKGLKVETLLEGSYTPAYAIDTMNSKSQLTAPQIDAAKAVFGSVNAFTYAKSLRNMAKELDMSVKGKGDVAQAQVESLLEYLTEKRYKADEWVEKTLLEEIDGFQLAENESDHVTMDELEVLKTLERDGIKIPTFIGRKKSTPDNKDINTKSDDSEPSVFDNSNNDSGKGGGKAIQKLLDENALLLRRLEQVQLKRVKENKISATYSSVERSIANEIVHRLQLMLKKTTPEAIAKGIKANEGVTVSGEDSVSTTASRNHSRVGSLNVSQSNSRAITPIPTIAPIQSSQSLLGDKNPPAVSSSVDKTSPMVASSMSQVTKSSQSLSGDKNPSAVTSSVDKTSPMVASSISQATNSTVSISTSAPNMSNTTDVNNVSDKEEASGVAISNDYKDVLSKNHNPDTTTTIKNLHKDDDGAEGVAVVNSSNSPNTDLNFPIPSTASTSVDAMDIEVDVVGTSPNASTSGHVEREHGPNIDVPQVERSIGEAGNISIAQLFS